MTTLNQSYRVMLIKCNKTYQIVVVVELFMFSEVCFNKDSWAILYEYEYHYFSNIALVLTAEILELAGNAARDNKKGRVTPRHILLAVANDEELHLVRKKNSFFLHYCRLIILTCSKRNKEFK